MPRELVFGRRRVRFCRPVYGPMPPEGVVFGFLGGLEPPPRAPKEAPKQMQTSQDYNPSSQSQQSYEDENNYGEENPFA